MEKMRLIESFSGGGMQRRGLENAGVFQIESIGTSEIDIWAIIAYAAIHCNLTDEMVENYDNYPSRESIIKWLKSHNIGYDPVKNKHYDWEKKLKSKNKFLEKIYLANKLSHNFGDISKAKHLPKCDMLTYSFPCTDISISGKIQGFSKDSGTRSSLVHEIMRLLIELKNRNQLPKYLLMENVKNLVSKKFIGQFNDIISLLDNIGYNTYWDILNGKYCGVPQNRERVFALSIRKDVDTGMFKFPQPFDERKRLKDILFAKVPEKYYITTDRAKKLCDDLVLNGKIKLDDYGITDENSTDRQTGVDLSIYHPQCREFANCITRREDRGISQTEVRLEPALLSGKAGQLEKFTDFAGTIMQRDYKGFPTYAMTGVIEIKR